MAFTSVISRYASQSVGFPAVLFLYSSTLSAGPVPNGVYRATAYAQSGKTASGELTHRHVVAADPDILPLGSRIKIRRAGRYSGEYVVADTGSKIQGRRLDIYMPNEKACRKFGSKLVRVKVIQLGDGTQAATKQADRAVKEDVSKDVHKQAVGNAATDEDWVKARANGTAGTSPPSPNPKQSSR
jgi:3D (Asp-Asp-Asp) domain-containing protein